MLLRLAAVALVAALAAGCGGAKKKTVPGSELPPGCTVAEVDQTVTSFLAAPSLSPTFEVYAAEESDGHRFTTRNGTKAVRYLRRRLALGERDRLIQLRVSQQDFNHVRITFELTRYGPDFLGRGIHQRLAQGAGTVDCAHQKVEAWVQKGP